MSWSPGEDATTLWAELEKTFGTRNVKELVVHLQLLRYATGPSTPDELIVEVKERA